MDFKGKTDKSTVMQYLRWKRHVHLFQSAVKNDGINDHIWMEIPATTTACLAARLRVALRWNDEVSSAITNNCGRTVLE
jgi:ligand-binding SRPBCC domain-containing protein